jgi:hypothetical protein
MHTRFHEVPDFHWNLPSDKTSIVKRSRGELGPDPHLVDEKEINLASDWFRRLNERE